MLRPRISKPSVIKAHEPAEEEPAKAAEASSEALEPALDSVERINGLSDIASFLFGLSASGVKASGKEEVSLTCFSPLTSSF